MTYEDAFTQAIALNAESKETARVYRLGQGGMLGDYPIYWATQCVAAPYSSAVLIGEVRRMTPR